MIVLKECGQIVEIPLDDICCQMNAFVDGVMYGCNFVFDDAAQVEVKMTRPRESNSKYCHSCFFDGDKVSFTVNPFDIERNGNGTLQVIFTNKAKDQRLKSEIYQTRIENERETNNERKGGV